MQVISTVWKIGKSRKYVNSVDNTDSEFLFIKCKLMKSYFLDGISI